MFQVFMMAMLVFNAGMFVASFYDGDRVGRWLGGVGMAGAILSLACS